MLGKQARHIVEIDGFGIAIVIYPQTIADQGDFYMIPVHKHYRPFSRIRGGECLKFRRWLRQTKTGNKGDENNEIKTISRIQIG